MVEIFQDRYGTAQGFREKKPDVSLAVVQLPESLVFFAPEPV